jgi:hypothetical protein
MLRIGQHGQHRIGVFDRRPRDEQASAALGQPLGDRAHLRRRLPHCQDDLGKAVTQATVMVHLREAEVFIRQHTQPFERGIDRRVAIAHGPQ